MIIDRDGFKYIGGGEKNSKTHRWRCSSCNKGCKASVTTLLENGLIIRVSGGHNHDPPIP